jgi:hypothetical protein
MENIFFILPTWLQNTVIIAILVIMALLASCAIYKGFCLVLGNKKLIIGGKNNLTEYQSLAKTKENIIFQTIQTLEKMLYDKIPGYVDIYDRILQDVIGAYCISDEKVIFEKAHFLEMITIAAYEIINKIKTIYIDKLKNEAKSLNNDLDNEADIRSLSNKIQIYIKEKRLEIKGIWELAPSVMYYSKIYDECLKYKTELKKCTHEMIEDLVIFYYKQLEILIEINNKLKKLDYTRRSGCSGF